MSEVDNSCPVCGGTDRQIHNRPLAWECRDCGTVYQDILKTDADGNATERLDTNIFKRGEE